jgi:hypothetical protein
LPREKREIARPAANPGRCTFRRFDAAERGGGNRPNFKWNDWPVVRSAAERLVIIESVEYLVNGLVTDVALIASISREL